MISKSLTASYYKAYYERMVLRAAECRKLEADGYKWGFNDAAETMGKVANNCAFEATVAMKKLAEMGVK